MTESRVEAVARAMELRADGLFAYRDSHHGIDPQTWQQIARAAIEANDAWLIAQQQADAKQFYKTMNERHRRLKGINQ